MKQFTARAYNTFDVNSKGHIVKSSETERLRDEIDYYLEIRKTDLGRHFPKVFGYNNEKSPFWLEMENLPKEKVSPHSLLEQLTNILAEFSEVKSEGSKELRQLMYIDKTIHYYGELLDHSFFKRFVSHDVINFNGNNLRSFDYIWPEIESIILDTLITDNDFTVIHGDLCFSNIIVGQNIKLIDPRGSFGKRGIYGDPLYDLAKIRHSYHGCYESIINDRFCLRYVDDTVTCWMTETGISFDHIPKFGDPRVKLIEGLIFIGMCSRHYDSLARQIVMYCTGLEILNEVLDENLL
jgi:aminoglycoside phosphotransferase